MKKLYAIAALLMVINGAWAQEADTTYWRKGGIGSVTFSQVSLTNWASGGDNSVSLNGFVRLWGDYRKDKITWNNTFEAGYGLIRQGDEDFRKTDDRINLITDFGYSLGKNMYWSSLLDFRTQFEEGLDGEDNRISDFFSPAYLLVATGFTWKPAEFFSLNYSPVTGKFTFVADQDLANNGAFGVDPAIRDEDGNILVEGSNARAELGSFLKMLFSKEIVTNVSFETRLELFTNYIESQGEIDVNWQNVVLMKVNDWLTVNWQTQLIWDEDILIEEFDASGELISADPKVQFKSVFGVGLVYKFGPVRNPK
ncbi:MAG: DUF3078 domain-containing protein [Bacteroidota bacterium]